MDQLVFANERSNSDADKQSNVWNILIVDDEKDVHEATLLALGRERVCNRHLNFEHAYSGIEAREILDKRRDFAVILLDVVMESEHAGFDLVRHVREDLGIQDTRIVLRTGQPGYAPELETISKYEINDYKSKSELTRNKLYTVLTASIRAYSQIRALELSKRGLEKIIRASKELLYLRGYREFASGVITQITGFFNLPEEGLVCVKGYGHEKKSQSDLEIVAAAGEYSSYIRQPVTEIKQSEIRDAILDTANQQEHVFEKDYSCLYFKTSEQTEMIVYLASTIDTPYEDLKLLEMFSTNIVACIDNVTLLEQRHEYAYQDQLLGIPNRLSFLQHIETKLKNKEEGLEVYITDVDQFAAINDTIGAQNGDQLLKQLADRLRNKHKQALVARLSGDTFGIVGHSSHVTNKSIESCIEAPFELNNSQHILSLTQGQVSVEDQPTAIDVLAQANIALKRAKSTLRGSHQCFQKEMLKETESRVHLLQNLRQAFDRESLYMVYQPKIELASGEIRGFEALMRWKTMDGEFVAPDQFIPLAETSGLIVLLGEWAIKASLLQIKKLRQTSGLDLSVAVNVSVVQFAHPNFIEMVRSALKFAECDPTWLELEITESFAMHDMNIVKSLIAELNLMGVRISIDDFGTGFSSLSYLEQLKVHSLKIDKSFIDRIQEQSADTRIPESILQLGRALELEVVAEGVETEVQKEWLKKNDCDVAQGYLFSRPLEPQATLDWLQEYNKKRGNL